MERCVLFCCEVSVAERCSLYFVVSCVLLRAVFRYVNNTQIDVWRRFVINSLRPGEISV